MITNPLILIFQQSFCQSGTISAILSFLYHNFSITTVPKIWLNESLFVMLCYVSIITDVEQFLVQILLCHSLLQLSFVCAQGPLFPSTTTCPRRTSRLRGQTRAASCGSLATRVRRETCSCGGSPSTSSHSCWVSVASDLPSYYM